MGSTLPSNLVLSEWITFNLQSPSEQNRKIALEEILAAGTGSMYRTVVETIRTEDPSIPCREIAGTILALDNARRSIHSLAQLELSPHSLQSLCETIGPSFKTAVMEKKIPAAAPGLLDLWRESLLDTTALEIAPIGLSLLARFGGKPDVGLALPFLKSELPEAANAALDLLQAHDPECFQRQITEALGSELPRVRFHAIKRLRAIDSAEAITYLQNFLEDPDPFLRQRAIRELLLFPFEVAESLYFPYLSRETVPLLLVLAGIYVASNPTPESPIHVFDVFSASQGVKKQILQLILNQLLEAIKASGILNQPIEEFVKSLKAQIQRRKQSFVLVQNLRDIHNEDVEIRSLALDRLLEFASNPKVSQTLRECAEQETDPDLRLKLSPFRRREEEPAVPAAQTLSLSLEWAAFEQLPPEKRYETLFQIQTSELFSQEKAALQILLSKSLPKAPVIHILHLFGSYGAKEDAPLLLPFLKKEEPAIIGAALQALGKLSPETVIDNINPLLRHNSFQVKTAALEIFLTADKEGALQILTSMTRSPQLPVRKKALGLLHLVDYPFAEPILLRFLDEEKNQEVKVQTALMLAANPTNDGMRALYKMTHDEQNQLRTEFTEIWNTALEAGSAAFSRDREDLALAIAGQVAMARKTAQTPVPAYAYKKVVEPKKQVAPDPELTATEVFSEPDRDKIKKAFAAMVPFFRVGVGIAVVLLVLFGLSSIPSGAPTGSGPAAAPHQLVTSKDDAMEAAPAGDSSRKSMPATISGSGESALAVVSGDRYRKTMDGAEREREAFFAEVKKAEEEYVQKWAAQLAANPETRMFGEFYQSPLCRTALEKLEENNIPEARQALTAILQDPDLSAEIKLFAANSLMGICVEGGDSDGLLDALEKFLGNLPPEVDRGGLDVNALRAGFQQFKTAVSQPANALKLDQNCKKLNGSDDPGNKGMYDGIMKLMGMKRSFEAGE
jgi:HEAT repeat protein